MKHYKQLAQAKSFENISNHFRLKLVRDTKNPNRFVSLPLFDRIVAINPVNLKKKNRKKKNNIEYTHNRITSAFDQTRANICEPLNADYHPQTYTWPTTITTTRAATTTKLEKISDKKHRGKKIHI